MAQLKTQLQNHVMEHRENEQELRRVGTMELYNKCADNLITMVYFSKFELLQAFYVRTFKLLHDSLKKI